MASKRFDNVPRLVNNMKCEWLTAKDFQVGKYSCHCDQYVQDQATVVPDCTVTATVVQPLTQNSSVQLTVPVPPAGTSATVKNGDVKVVANVGADPYVVTVSSDGNEFQPIDIPAGRFVEFRYLRGSWTVESNGDRVVQWSGGMTMTGGGAWQSVPLRGTTSTLYSPGADRAVVVRVVLSGIDSTGAFYGQYVFDAGVVTDAAGTATVTGGGAPTVVAENPGTFDARIVASGTDIDLQVTDNGAGTQVMSWVARAEIVGV